MLLLEFEVGVAESKKQGGNTGKFLFILYQYLSDTSKCKCSICIHDSGSDRANARIKYYIVKNTIAILEFFESY